MAGKGALVRRGALRIQGDIAHRVRLGHPWIFRDALRGRPLREGPGEVVEIVDPTGAFVGRGLYDPEAPIAVRVVSRDRNEQVDAAAMRRRVVQAAKLRETLPELTQVEALRVLAGESEKLPGVSVDRFGDYLVAHLFSPALLPWVEALYDALEEHYHPQAIYEQRRFRPLTGDAPRAPAVLVRGTVAPVELVVGEGDLRFGVDVTAPGSVGLFPDLRRGREAVRRHAAGRRVLNLFSYTGAISLAAMRGGAAQVTSVDLSAKAHARARRNAALSDLDAESGEYLAGDAFRVLAVMADRSREFDLVVIDPPTFAQGKGRTFGTLTDYADLVHETVKVLAPGGLLVAAANTVKLSVEEHDRAVADGAARFGAELRVIDRCGLPGDFPVSPGFPEGNYLKIVIAARV